MTFVRTLLPVGRLCLLALLVAACTPRQPYPLPERPNIPFGQGRLWQVEGTGTKSSYVFAILRTNDKRLMPFPQAIATALQASDMEAFDTVRDPLTAETFYDVEKLKLPEGMSLSDLIGARSFGILTWHMKQSLLRPKDNIKPWVFWLYMGGANWGFFDYDSYFDHRGLYDLDTQMRSDARRAGREVASLLSDQEAFELYNEMPLDLQAELLKLRLDSYSDSTPEVAKVQLYLDGDLALLSALRDEYLASLPPEVARAIRKRLVTDPNRVMVERMAPLFQKAPTFVAVEALHVPGEEGILRLLEQRGYTVTRLH